MQLLAKKQIPPVDRTETVFRVSPWWAMLGCLLFVSLLLGVPTAMFVTTFFSPDIHGFHWSRILLALFILIMSPFCLIYSRTCTAAFQPSNWLARIGPGGMLVKYRSYLHDDSPEEDPVAIRLSWDEVERVHLQKEVLHTRSSSRAMDVRRVFLAVRLDRRVNVGALKSALSFELHRKPAYFKISDLKHELFMARKNKAPAPEVARLKQAIRMEKARHPGRHSRGRFQHHPVTFAEPDLLNIEWVQVTPGKKTLGGLLSRYTTFVIADSRHIHADRTMTDDEFNALLAMLLGRADEVEAIKLVRRHMGCDIAEAKRFIEEKRRDS